MLNRLGDFGIDLIKTGFSAVESIIIKMICYRNLKNLKIKIEIGQITKITNIIANFNEEKQEKVEVERDDLKYNRLVKDVIQKH